MRVLLGAAGANATVQNIARALHEVGWLDAYYTGLARRVSCVPNHVVLEERQWELARSIASRLRADPRIVDSIWERSEHALDGRCARRLENSDVDAFFGIEHGSLAALRASRRLGKPGVVAFLSPHHSFRQRWVDTEYARFPEMLTPARERLVGLARERDRRRDEEAATADVIFVNSKLTQRTLEQAGFGQKHYVVVPNGAPEAISAEALPRIPRGPVRFVYAGSVAAHKGVHYLLEAWRRLGLSSGAELHLYGNVDLPRRVFARCPNNVVLHGRVSSQRLWSAYEQATALIFPTLYDGFGMVVTEALARGLPVVTTSNAGAAELIEAGSTGFIVPPADSEALAERIEWCLSHPRELLEMRPQALASVRDRTWQRFRAELRDQLSAALQIHTTEVAA